MGGINSISISKAKKRAATMSEAEATHPSATAPPLTLTLSASRLSALTVAGTTSEKACKDSLSA